MLYGIPAALLPSSWPGHLTLCIIMIFRHEVFIVIWRMYCSFRHYWECVLFLTRFSPLTWQTVVVVQQQPQSAVVVQTRRTYGTGDHGLILAILASFCVFFFGTWLSLFCTIPAIFVAISVRNKFDVCPDYRDSLISIRLDRGEGGIVCLGAQAPPPAPYIIGVGIGGPRGP